MEFEEDNIKHSTPQDVTVQEPKPKKKVVINDTNLKKEKSEFRVNFESTSVLWRVTALAFLTGFLCLVIAYGTPYWLYVNDATGSDIIHFGLWSQCLAITNCTYRDVPSGCMNTVRGFGSIGVVCGLVLCLLLLCYIRRPANRRRLSVALVTSCFLTALSTQISSAVFARTTGCVDGQDVTLVVFGWSMSLAFSSVLLSCLSGISFLIHELRLCSSGKKRGYRHKNNTGLYIT